MATLRKMFLLGLWAPTSYIAIAASLTINTTLRILSNAILNSHLTLVIGSCPTSQELIANNKCCPGPAMSSDKSGVTYCCVTKPDTECSAALCFDGTCVAKIAVDDSDYGDKVQKALSGSSDDSGSSSSSTSSGIQSPTFLMQPLLLRAQQLSLGPNDTTSTTASDSAVNTNSAASSGNNAVVGMVIGLASLCYVLY
ncbi:unnamed protein product [Clonostachys chloroleuca]|uniref:Uncharacterized protein n=1 Tax=Clonostachys chloroleuca TaxID=1926264 RepID=A0AA35M8D3_9HYPO|nr:unnamed protein product [Clonostachys chloroleuca]